MPMPNWIARILGRAGHRATRRFDAAVHSRLTQSWVMSERSINTELRGDLDALRRRSRDLAKNSPMGKKFLDMCVANIAGPNGFTLQVRVTDDNGKADELANRAIEAAYLDWCRARNCDVAGRLSFRQMTRTAVRGLARDGETLVRVRQGAANPYGYALQLLDVERLDTHLNREASPGVNQIHMGVEMDADGRAINYHLLTGTFGRDPTGKKHAVIPAGEMIHIFVSTDPEQVRGIPWMHAAMLAVNDLKGYNHAAIVAARIGASKMGFFVLPDGNTQTVADGEDEQGAPFMEAEPGQFGVIRGEGADFKSFNPDYPHANYASFVKEHKRDIASGLNVAYNTLANDLEGVNFSSIRSGTLEERDHWMLAQNDFTEVFCDVVYEGWLSNALLAGAIKLPNGSALPAAKLAKFRAHEFQGRRWQWVDPLKDIEASVKAIENGLASPYTIAAQQGLDADDVLDDIARFQAAAKAKGVQLGSPVPPQQQPADQETAAEDKKVKTLTIAALARAAEPQPAAAAPTINVAPVIHTPAVRVDNHLPAPHVSVAAPEVRVNVEAPAVTVQPPAVEVRVDAHMPEQRAPDVQVTVEMPDELKMAVTSLPARETTSTVERNSAGDIVKTKQTEMDI